MRLANKARDKASSFALNGNHWIGQDPVGLSAAEPSHLDAYACPPYMLHASGRSVLILAVVI
jgi:hypothetical protein